MNLLTAVSCYSRLAALVCVLSCTLTLQAQNEPITKCSNLTGYNYYIPGGLLSHDHEKIGWGRDDVGLGDTSIGLFRDENSGYSIKYHTPERGWHIPGGEARFQHLGASVSTLIGIGMNYIFLVDYPDRSAELYMFVLHDQKEGQVAVSLMRDGLIINARLFVGKCEPIR